MDTTDKTDKIESKSNESTPQSAETIEELINRKVEELLHTQPAKILNLTKEKVLHDWKKEEATLKEHQLKDEELIKSTYNRLQTKYSETKNEYENKYAKYSIYKTAQKYAVDNYLENFEDNYLVKGIGLERKQMMELYSTPGAGKTFLSLEMAYKMAIGGWILNTPEYAVTKPLKVLYIDNENKRDLIRRLISMELYDVGLANKNLYLIQNGGVFTEDGTKESLPVDIDGFGKDPNDKDAESLTDAIIGMVMTGSMPKPDVIFIDPLIDSMSGDENSTKDMSNFVRDIKRLIEYTEAAVIINHHPKKNSTGRNLYDSRGSSVLVGALDMVWELQVKEKTDKKAGKKSTEPQKIVSVKSAKDNRNGTEIYPYDYGIYNTLIDELNPHWAETWTGTKFNGVVVSKIYNSAQKRARLRAEILALIHQQKLDPATISDNEFEEKIKSIIKKYPNAYSDNDKRIDEAYKELKDPKNKDIEKEEETSSDDNEKK